MHRRVRLSSALLAGVLLLSSTACGETGAGVVSETSESSTGSAASAELTPEVEQAVEGYSTYVNAQAAEMAALTTVFTDAIRAADLDAAKAAYAPSREPWERIEPIAGLIEELDGKLDSRVDDFESVDDPEFTGWHRLEYILWEEDTTEGAVEFADQLDADVATLQDELGDLEIPAAAVPVGASELIEEVSLGKITGEEDRYSKTDLWDLAANVDGAEQAIELLAPALDQADPQLLTNINTSIGEVRATLKPLQDGDGWQLYCVENDEFPSDLCEGVETISTDTLDQLTAQTAALSELTAQVAGALELDG